VIIADTSGLLALFNRREPAHDAVRRAVERTDDVLVVSPYVVAELDYLVATRLGVDAELIVLGELTGGAYELADLSVEDVSTCATIIDRYRDQEIGIADASLVVLAQRYSTRNILTLDRRHFDVLRPLDGGRFKILGP
jgi:uncharacterized protein